MRRNARGGLAEDGGWTDEAVRGTTAKGVARWAGETSASCPLAGPSRLGLRAATTIVPYRGMSMQQAQHDSQEPAG